MVLVGSESVFCWDWWCMVNNFYVVMKVWCRLMGYNGVFSFVWWVNCCSEWIMMLIWLMSFFVLVSVFFVCLFWFCLIVCFVVNKYIESVFSGWLILCVSVVMVWLIIVSFVVWINLFCMVCRLVFIFLCLVIFCLSCLCCILSWFSVWCSKWVICFSLLCL